MTGNPGRHLVVALDGSQLSESSLPVACQLARALRGRLTLLHVLEARPPQTVHGQPHLRTADAAWRYLQEAAARIRGEGLAVEVHVASAALADVAACIAAQAEALHADILVLAAHGWGGLRARLLGHVPQQVLVRSGRPVLLIPAPAAPSPGIQLLLVPVDPQGESHAALPWAEEIAVACRARLHLVTVIPTPATVSPEDAAAAVFLPQAAGAVLDLASDAAWKQLQDLQASLRGRGLAADAELRRGDVVQQLAAAVSDRHPDLVIMATHARGPWESFWAGSVVARLTPVVRVPVLLVPLTSTT